MKGDHADTPALRPWEGGSRIMATLIVLLPEDDITPPEQANA